MDKIKKALLLAYLADVGCTLTNADCNDLTKYIASLETQVRELDMLYKMSLGKISELLNDR